MNRVRTAKVKSPSLIRMFQKKHELGFRKWWKRTLDRNGLDHKRLGLSQTRQGDDSDGRLWVCHGKWRDLPEMHKKMKRKDSSKQVALSLFRFPGEKRWEKQVALFSCSVEESSRVTEVLCANGFCVVTNNSRGMEDFGRDRGKGRVSGKSWDWVKTLDVAEVKFGCPGKVLNRDERRVIKGCCEQMV
ncbi:unnamed protein product [Lactuca saligna]|uniref:Uncharacterized protein n=1 Tax=Lactuca saligna TaxID=75948 RepID=A0AA35YPV3_LACSI|nr:unnamed protein product [Lactuca saligna]